MPVRNIDYNIDVAQGFGYFKNNMETELLDYVSSANISCGFHAGDPMLIREYLLKCKDKNITIGAHIGFNDINGLGYRPMELTEDEIEAIVIYQLGAISAFAKSYSLVIDYVRPHGAMYKLASENFEFSCSVAKAIQKFDKWLSYTCLDNEILERVAEQTSIVINREIFADKIYTNKFTPSFESNKYIDEEETLNRVNSIIYSSEIKLENGDFMSVNCDTIHFDTKNPYILKILEKANEIVKPTPVNYNKAAESGWV